MSGRQVKQLAVHDTVTHTLEIGRRIRTARESQLDPVKGLLQFLDTPGRGTLRARALQRTDCRCPARDA
jgi:DUF917 family protein